MKNTMSKLFEPFKMGNLQLKNRTVMSPMTRRRAENPELAADEMIALYYRQRSSAGLIVSEGSQISPEAYGYTFSPGCYSQAQIEGWKKVTKAVHENDGKIFIQLWHVGRLSHPLLQPDGKLPLAPSAIKPEGQVLTQEGQKDYVTPRAMTTDEIYKTIRDFGQAAKNALEAGFDGVEIHGAHGYLVDIFILDGTNKRDDKFGGSIENRARFLFLILEEIQKYLKPSQIGLRLSPKSVRPDAVDSAPEKTFGYIIEKLNDYNLAYLHLSEMMSPETRINPDFKSIVPFYRNIYKETLISCGGHSRESANLMLENNEADLIAFGKPFISNPDLAERLQAGTPLTEPDKATFYHGGAKGYVDYPAREK
jgi:N-ethylmaleimide reductase